MSKSKAFSRGRGFSKINVPFLNLDDGKAGLGVLDLGLDTVVILAMSAVSGVMKCQGSRGSVDGLVVGSLVKGWRDVGCINCCCENLEKWLIKPFGSAWHSNPIEIPSQSLCQRPQLPCLLMGSTCDLILLRQ